jgi:uncharacterized protein YfdQ (DUF2303 family)
MNTNFSDAFDAGQKHALATSATIEDLGDLKVLRHGGTVTALEKYQEAPVAKRGAIELYDEPSFAAYVNLHKNDAATRLFADVAITALSLVAIFDHHAPDRPGWGRHRAGLKARLTDEWKAWHEKHNKAMTQVEFAEFVEHHMAEIARPDGGSLLEMITTLELKRDIVFASKVDLHDGRMQFQYEDQDAAGAKGEVKIPREFSLSMQPFEGAPKYELVARLRYRLKDGKVLFFIALVQPEKVLQTAFNERIEAVRLATGLTVLKGTAPAEVTPLG